MLQCTLLTVALDLHNDAAVPMRYFLSCLMLLPGWNSIVPVATATHTTMFGLDAAVVTTVVVLRMLSLQYCISLCMPDVDRAHISKVQHKQPLVHWDTQSSSAVHASCLRCSGVASVLLPSADYTDHAAVFQASKGKLLRGHRSIRCSCYTGRTLLLCHIVMR